MTLEIAIAILNTLEKECNRADEAWRKLYEESQRYQENPDHSTNDAEFIELANEVSKASEEKRKARRAYITFKDSAITIN